MSSSSRSATKIDRYIGKKLRLIRLLQNESQQSLGDALGVTFQQIQKYEKGNNRVAAARLWEIAKHYDVGLDYFFENKEEYDAKRFLETQMITTLADSDFGVKMAMALNKIESADMRRQILNLARTAGKFGS